MIRQHDKGYPILLRFGEDMRGVIEARITIGRDQAGRLNQEGSIRRYLSDGDFELTDEEAGEGRYELREGDLATEGDYLIQATAIWPGGKRRSGQIGSFRVLPAIDQPLTLEEENA